MDWWWDLLKAMDAHEGQAAWAGALGSVCAIFASAALALWVPIHLRSQEGRLTAERSLRVLQAAGIQSAELLKMISHSVGKGSTTPMTVELLDSRVGGIRALLATVDRTVLQVDASTVLGVLEMYLSTSRPFVEEVVKNQPTTALKVARRNEEILREETADRLNRLVVVKLRGTWVVGSQRTPLDRTVHAL